MDLREHRQILELCSRQFEHPRQFLARVEAIYASAPPESYDLLELADGRGFERFSRIQFVEERNVGPGWNFRHITARNAPQPSFHPPTTRCRHTPSRSTHYATPPP